MRAIVIAAGLTMIFATPIRADDAKAVIERAIQMTANSELRLNRLANVIRTERGVLHLPGSDVPVERISFLSPPQRLKYDAKLIRGGRREAFLIALNGVNGWKSEQGQIGELALGQLAGVKDDAYVWYLATLLPTRHKDATFKSMPPATVNNRQTSVVNLAMPGRADAQLHFDKETGLLLRIRMKSSEPGVGERDWDFSDHKDFDGIKLPTKYSSTQRNKKIEEWTIEGYQTPDRIEDKVFAKP